MRILIVASGFIASSATFWAAGCGSNTGTEGCPSSPSCSTSTGSASGHGAVGTSTGSTGTTSTGSTGSTGSAGSGGAGGGGVVVPSCDGDPTADPKVVIKECGLFVRGDPNDTDDGEGVGTPEKPFKTLQAAINVVTDKWIFVCTKFPFNEQITITKANVAVYGGFDCDNGWAWKQDAKSSLVGPANAIGMTISGPSVKVENFSIKAAKATKPGGSSIAVLVNKAAPSFIRCDMIADQAGQGADGQDAATPTAPGGPKSNDGGNSCSLDTVPGGNQVANICPGGALSIGGKGGDGTASTGNPGGPGQPGNVGGQAGKGEPSNSPPNWSCVSNDGIGHGGIQGSPGTPGTAATGDQSIGALDFNGFKPTKGGDGTPGQPGQGGGGGGSTKGIEINGACMGAAKGGAGGGSGGSGGCGGVEGKGAQSAGASIALVSIASSGMTLTDVFLTAATGVDGGTGGDAQAGGAGAPGGAGGSHSGVFGLKDGCAGGIGGNGGNGGAGGGGRGGHSIGIAYTDMLPKMDAEQNITIKVGTPGKGGNGGNGNYFMNKGDGGTSALTLKFP